jgi:hypothetical protein
MKAHGARRKKSWYWWALLVSISVAVIVSFITVHPTFSVAASTETITVNMADDITPRWYLDNVQTFFDDDPKGQVFSGSFQFAPGDVVVVERISFGPLRINISRAARDAAKIGELFSFDEQPVRSVNRSLTIRIENLDLISKAGKNVVLSFAGSVELGAKTYDTPEMSVPVVRAGTLMMLGHNLLSKSLYNADTYNLTLGETLDLQRVTGPAFGFVVVDERPAMNVSFRQVAGSAEVVTLPGNGYEVDLSVWDRLKNDQTLQALWIISAFLFAIPKKWREFDEQE